MTATAVLAVLALAPAAARADTFSVSSTADTDTPGTLRHAINTANASTGVADTIDFAGLASGTQTIVLSSALPAITDQVTIDGTGHESTPGAPNVVISGTGINNGLEINAAGSAVKGLSLINFTAAAIAVEQSNVTVSGNYVGLDAGGAMHGNGTGVSVAGSTASLTGVTIGGTAAGARNVISGNGNGLVISKADATAIQGNYVGTTADGTHAMPNQNGITVQGDASENHIGNGQAGGGNLISGNTQAGVNVVGTADHTHFAGNLIGTGPSGTGSIPNGTGIHVGANAQNTLIGSLFAGTRNIVSGNSGAGIRIENNANNNSVKGNYIGLDVNGIRDPNQDGVSLGGGGVNNLIGGSAVGEGNFISGNNGNGIDVTDQLVDIEGNTIGLDPSNDQPRGNGFAGVRLAGVQNTVGHNLISSNEQHGIQLGGFENHVFDNLIGTNLGGSAPRGNGGAGINVKDAVNGLIDGGNLISGNTLFGIEVDGPSGGLQIFGNLIGTDQSGTAPLGSPQPIGIGIDASHGPVTNTTIGGTDPGQPNTIAFNKTNVSFEMFPGTFESTGTAIHANSIFGSTTGMGIDIGGDGITPNDAGDADNGPNNVQNFPVLTSAVTSGGKTVIDGTLNSTSSTSGYAIDLYSNPSCSKTGNGEAQTYLGTIAPVDTDANGNASFQVTLAAPVTAGQVVTAIATDPNGNSSEISACRTVTVPAPAPVTSTGEPGPQSGNPIAGPPAGGGSPIQVFRLPVAKLKLPKTEHLLKDKAIVFTLGSATDADYSASAVVNLPKLGAARAMKLKSAKGKLLAGKTAKVKLRASKAVLAAARRAFAKHKKVTATITIVLKGAGGTAKPVKRKLRLVP